GERDDDATKDGVRDETDRGVRRLIGSEWLGLGKDVAGGTVEAGFSTAGRQAKIRLDGAQALARGLAVLREHRFGDCGGRTRIFAVEAGMVCLGDRTLLSSSTPITVEIDVAGEDWEMTCQAKDAARLQIAR